MTVRVSEDGGAVELIGVCASQDAEVLLGHLLARTDAVIDWQACEAAHTAVVQVILAARPVIRGPPKGRFLIDMVEPLLTRG